jgi:ferritin-like metal-binding protein YciE
MDKKAQETITKYLGDMHALVSHGLQPVTRQADLLKNDDHPEAYQAAMRFKNRLELQLSAIDTRLKALGHSPTAPMKDAAATVAGVAAGIYNAVRTEEASKSIRDDYVFFSNCNIAYLMLHTTALGLGDHETAMLAERGYHESALSAMEIDKIMPILVVQELQQDGLPMRDVSAQCEKLVREAWAREAMASGWASTGSHDRAPGSAFSGTQSSAPAGAASGMGAEPRTEVGSQPAGTRGQR